MSYVGIAAVRILNADYVKVFVKKRRGKTFSFLCEIFSAHRGFEADEGHDVPRR